MIGAFALFPQRHLQLVLETEIFEHYHLVFAFQALRYHLAMNSGNPEYVNRCVYQTLTAISTLATRLLEQSPSSTRFDLCNWGWSGEQAKRDARLGMLTEYNVESAFEDIRYLLEVLYHTRRSIPSWR